MVQRGIQQTQPDGGQQCQHDVTLVLHQAEVDPLRQHHQQDAAAVQRRHRDEVEHRKADVHQHHILQEHGKIKRGIVHRCPVVQKLPRHHGKVGKDEVCHGACQRGERHAPLGIFEVAGVGGDRLCPAHARKHHAQRAQQIEVCQRVERKPPLTLCGIVAQQPRSQRVPRLVERDGHQRHQRTNEIVDSLRCHRSSCLCCIVRQRQDYTLYNTIFPPGRQGLWAGKKKAWSFFEKKLAFQRTICYNSQADYFDSFTSLQEVQVPWLNVNAAARV